MHQLRDPGVRLDGKLLVHFGAASRHCAFYPGAVVEASRRELQGYDVSKGTIRFPPGSPLPAALIKKLVKAQIARRVTARREPAGGAGTRHRGRPHGVDDFRRMWGRQGYTKVRLDLADEETLRAALTLARQDAERRSARRRRSAAARHR